VPLAILACCAGCGDGVVRFERDAVLHTAAGLTERQSASIDATLLEFFGTPDEPQLPEGSPALAGFLDEGRLAQAAGPVISHTPGVTQGLYRRHCARCHGVTGDGRGPTARYQAPYPRDFRRGVFKWKKTYRDAPPTADDLHATLERGVPGTAMPSFALLSEEERETLRQYAVYLAIRGQTERALVDFVAGELPARQPLVPRGELREELLGEIVEPIAAAWSDAESHVVETPEFASPTAEQVALGRELYHSERTGCAKCHGPEGQGGAVAGSDYEVDYDVWSRDRVETPLAGDLPPRPSIPRSLVGSTPHGGATPADLYRRLHQGVAGTPMPAVGGLAPGAEGALSDEEVAALVAYAQTLLAPVEPATPTTEVAAR